MFEVNELLKFTGGRLAGVDSGGRITGISIDSRTIKPKEAFIAIKGSNFDGHNFIKDAIDRGAGLIVHGSKFKVHSEKKIPFITVADTLKTLGDIARWQRKKFDIPVIAVTGSNGKTTTKEMIAHVLSAKFRVLKNEGTKNNPIGLPMTLRNLNSSHDMAVLEVGTNHFGEVEYLAKICLPNIGVITNIGASHLEFFNDLKGVLKEKYALLDNLEDPRIAILNTDDSLLRKKISGKTKKPFVFSFGIKNRCDFSASNIKFKDGRYVFLVNKRFRFTLNTCGYYNIYNALAAITLGRLYGISHKDIAEALASFNFPRSRLKLLELGKIRFIDDTYNSNPLSLMHALEAFDNFKAKGRKIFVMGDMLELGKSAGLFHRRAGRRIAQVCDLLITVGELSKLSARTAERFGFSEGNIFTCESSGEARDTLFNKIALEADDIVLVKGSRSMKMEEVFKI